jgi:hypothetical protein
MSVTPIQCTTRRQKIPQNISPCGEGRPSSIVRVSHSIELQSILMNMVSKLIGKTVDQLYCIPANPSQRTQTGALGNSTAGLSKKPVHGDSATEQMTVNLTKRTSGGGVNCDGMAKSVAIRWSNPNRIEERKRATKEPFKTGKTERAAIYKNMAVRIFKFLRTNDEEKRNAVFWMATVTQRTSEKRSSKFREKLGAS